MCSKNFIPRVLTCALFLTGLCWQVKAQTSSLSQAWKNSNQTRSESQAKPENTSSTNTEALIEKEKLNPSVQTATTVSAAWSFKPPVEPAAKPANPTLDLGNKITTVDLKNLNKDVAVMPEDEIVGVEPPRAFQATAYSLSGRTRSGAHTRRGVIAADPRVLPLGSVVHLKAGNYSGVYTVHDTGSAIKGKLIDVWMPSSREARSFGRRSVRLTVLKYGRGGKPAKK